MRGSSDCREINEKLHADNVIMQTRTIGMKWYQKSVSVKSRKKSEDG